MNGPDDLARLAAILGDHELAELQRLRQAHDRIRAEIEALDTISRTGFETMAAGGAQFDAAWRTWHENRRMALRRDQAIARALVEEQSTRTRRALAQAEAAENIAETEKARRRTARTKAQDDFLDALQAMKRRP